MFRAVHERIRQLETFKQTTNNYLVSLDHPSLQCVIPVIEQQLLAVDKELHFIRRKSLTMTS